MNEINTIFYFPSSLTFLDYQTKLANEELSARTIVFAAAQNSIYMGGRQYGSYTNVTDVTRIIEENAYDDSTLREQLDALDNALQSANNTASEEYAANHAFIEGINTTIKDRIETLLNNSDWVNGHLPSGSNFGELQVDAYLQRLGVWSDGENHTKANATWTEIALTTNAIQNTVNQIYQNDDLTQGFKQAIVNIAIGDTVKSEIGSYIATNYIDDLDDQGNHIIKVLEWLYSGMTSETSENSTFANLLSNAQIGTNTALSKISTAVKKVKDATGNNFTGDLISTTTITTQVNDSLATLKQSAEDNFVKTEIIGKINENSQDIASIVLSITEDSSDTTIANKISDWKAGLITSANKDSAMASLLTENANNSFKSGLVTYVKNNVGEFDLATENDVTSASIVGKVNEAGSSININANKINLVGQTTFLDAVGRNITAQKFNAIAYYSGSTVSTEENSTLGFYEIMDPTNGFEIGIKSRLNTSDDWNTTRLVHLHNTGQGELAGGLIAWDNSGINSNTKIDIGANLGTTTLHAAPKWNHRTNKWSTNTGTINIGTPVNYLLSQPYYETTQDNETVKVPITSANFASSPASSSNGGLYSSWDNLIDAGKTTISVWGDVILLNDARLRSVSSYEGESNPNNHGAISISPLKLSFIDPSGSELGYIDCTGRMDLPGISSNGSMTFIDGDLICGPEWANSFIEADRYRVSKRVPYTTESSEYNMITNTGTVHKLSVSDRSSNNPIHNEHCFNGSLGIIELVNNTTYMTICGGIIICVGTLENCINTLLDTYEFSLRKKRFHSDASAYYNRLDADDPIKIEFPTLQDYVTAVWNPVSDLNNSAILNWNAATAAPDMNGNTTKDAQLDLIPGTWNLLWHSNIMYRSIYGPSTWPSPSEYYVASRS